MCMLFLCFPYLNLSILCELLITVCIAMVYFPVYISLGKFIWYGLHSEGCLVVFIFLPFQSSLLSFNILNLLLILLCWPTNHFLLLSLCLFNFLHRDFESVFYCVRLTVIMYTWNCRPKYCSLVVWVQLRHALCGEFCSWLLYSDWWILWRIVI